MARWWELSFGACWVINGNSSVHTFEIQNFDYHKILLDKISVLSGEEYYISGAKFTIYASKTDTEGNLIPNTDTSIGMLIEANSSGQYSSNFLPNGTYWICETEPPEGFKETERRDSLSEEEADDFGEPVEEKGALYESNLLM